MRVKRVVVRNYRVFRNLDVELRAGLNVIVGDNESGKSTLLEAMTLALTGRIHGRWAREQLTASWFNLAAVSEFFEHSGRPADLPVIDIELYLDDVDDALQVHRGVHNSRTEDSVGLCLTISPATDFADELTAYLDDADRPAVLPIEYYTVRWSDFADQDLRRRPKGLGHIFIDARTIRSTAGVDHHTRQLVNDYLEPHERAAISIAQIRELLVRRAPSQDSRRQMNASASETTHCWRIAPCVSKSTKHPAHAGQPE